MTTPIAKLVTLKFDGDLQRQGFRVTLEIGRDGDRPDLALSGTLPPAPELLQHLHRWQQHYRSLDSTTRIKPKAIIYKGSIHLLDACQQAAAELGDRLQQWLHSDSFRVLDQRLREALNRDDPIRIVLRSTDPHLAHLPWHLWDVLDRYPHAEVTLGAPTLERLESTATSAKASPVRILAILGDSEGIDVEVDRRLLESLPDADVTFLVEPSRAEVNDHLWEQPWHILFFAGHSHSQPEQGCIAINPTDSLTLAELKYALRRAIAQGLQLAIFNSCDGLGLAQALEPLRLPHLIVMREPVPDRVAQAFLTQFLKAFSQGDSLHLAVRQARERLQGFEREFPCASWLPCLYHISAEPPLDWHALQQPVAPPSSPARSRPRPLAIGVAIASSLVAVLGVMGVRSLGLLQRWELSAYDQLMRSRPTETVPKRLFILEVTEADVNSYGYPVPDAVLVEAIERLQAQQSRVIGLDLFRSQVSATLQEALQASNMVALCSIRHSDNPDRPGIPPPPGLPENRTGFSNIVVDPDQVLRRQLLFMQPEPTDPCATRFALNTLLALHYLDREGLEPQTLENHHIQLGKARFIPLDQHSGPYHRVDRWGFQVLLNYGDLDQFADRLSLSQVLQGEPLPDLRDRVVLIGMTAPITNPTDYFFTPLSGTWAAQPVPGVHLQAHMVNHVLTAALEGRGPLNLLPGWGDRLWLLGWGAIAAGLTWNIRRYDILGMALGGVVVILYGVAWGAFVMGWWLPLIPAGLALISSSGAVLLGKRYLASTTD